MSALRKKMGKWKEFLLQAMLMTCFYLVLELLFHFSEGFGISARLIYPMIFCLPVGFILTSIFSLFPKVVNEVLSILCMLTAAVWTCVQVCYSGVFKTYMEISKISMGADVAGNFGNEMKDAIIDRIPRIVMLIGLVLLFSLLLILLLKPEKKSPVLCLAGVIVGFLLHAGCYGMLFVEGQSAYSPISMYRQYPVILDNDMQNFGVLTSFRLDLSGMLFGRGKEEEKDVFKQDDMSILLGNNESIAAVSVTPAVTASPTKIPVLTPLPDEEPEATPLPTPSPEPTSIPIPVKTKNVLDFDINAMLKEETDTVVRAVHEYVKSQPGSNINQYTGYFEGYNLIMICAESFSSYMIDEELTPTLYKMSNGGFVFQNYYGTFKSITTNGEYAFCTGLMPNTVGKVDELKTNSTFLLSADKYLPYCMGNVFTDMGAQTFAYHGNDADYYHRNLTHPNMGYRTCRFRDGAYIDGVFNKNGKLNFSTKRPTSDEETALQTLQDYLDNKDENGKVKQFHAYYMTYSGHHPYYDVNDTEHVKSPMAYENREIVDKLNCSGNVKTYIAVNLELENMLTEILAALEDAGCLDNTVIVLTNDHYPYGLTDKEFKELATLMDKKIEATYGIYQNSFICYNAGMKEPVTVDAPCCTVDILPTLLNLFGVEYDSRLLAGTDVLDANSFHVAMLYNQSFITDKLKYNTADGKVKYLVDKSTVSEEYVDACINYVKNKFEISLQIINNDYYKIIYDYLNRQSE